MKYSRLSWQGLFVVLLASAWLSGCSGPREADYRFEVTFPAGTGGILVPVTVELPPGFADTAGAWEVLPRQGKTEESVYAQIIPVTPENPVLRAIFLWDPQTTGEPSVRQFILHRSPKPVMPAFSFEDTDSTHLAVLQEGKPVLAYTYGMYLKEGVPEDRRRSCYLSPVYGLDGELLSDDFPVDHFHHRGIFWAWPQVFIGGDSLSLWDIYRINQRFERWTVRQTGPVFARLEVENGWYAGEKKVAAETLKLTVYKAGKSGRALDVSLSWQALEEPIRIIGSSAEQKGYGGFSFRFAPFEGPVITTSSGTQAEDTNLLPFPWADLSARFNGTNDVSGAAIFENESNSGFPNGWTLRHYGFLGVAWPGLEPFTFQPGEPVETVYRVWLHRGNVADGKVKEAYEAFSEPAQGRLLNF